MNRLIIVVSSIIILLLLAGGCGTRDNRVTGNPKRTLAVNASGLEGIGSLKIGMTVKDSEKALTANNKRYRRGYSSFDITDMYPICLEGYTQEEAAKYGYRCYVYNYYIADDNNIGIKMGFLRDTLKLMTVDNAIVCMLGLPDVLDAFMRKYGKGYVIEQGRCELWVGERVMARHYFGDNKKANITSYFSEDKYGECFFIYEKDALILQELNNIKAKIDSDRIDRRNKELDNI